MNKNLQFSFQLIFEAIKNYQKTKDELALKISFPPAVAGRKLKIAENRPDVYRGGSL